EASRARAESRGKASAMASARDRGRGDGEVAAKTAVPCATARRGSLPYCQRGWCGAPPREEPPEGRLRGQTTRPTARRHRVNSDGGRTAELLTRRREMTKSRFLRPIRYSGRVSGGGKDRGRLQSCPKPMTLCSDARIEVAVAIPQSHLLAN